MSNSNFELLRTKPIIAIFDGDSDFGEIPNTDIKISLPYLSGSTLCDISTQFGLPVSYSWGGGAKSRWEYFDDLLKHCIKNHKESELLTFLFAKERFVGKLNGYTPQMIDFAYQEIIKTIMAQINGALYFGGHELVKNGNKYIIHKIDEEIAISSSAVKTVDRSYITSLSERAMKDIAEGNFDSAITKSRTLLEEVFCYVIEKKQEFPSDSGDIGKLYNQVKSLYNMHQDRDIDKRINGLLSGLEKIVSAIAEMRNKGSDSHGVGARRIGIAEHHARLFVNSAMTMADFVLSVSEKQV